MKKTKDEIILSALLANPTVRAASAACGISETQIYVRLRNQDFKAKYDAARRELLERNTAALQNHLAGAIETMAAISQDEDATPQTRLNAADAIIRNALRLTEQTDILTRLEALENSH